MFTCLLAFYMFTLSDAKPSPNYYRPQRSCGQGYVFTRVCDSVNRGGVSGEPPPPDKADPPGTKENPPPALGPGRPPRDQGEPPRTRQTPPGPRRNPPQDQADPPALGPGRPPYGPGRPPRPRRTPPRTRQTPPDQGEPPPKPFILSGTRQTPPGPRRTPPPGRTLQHTVNERPVRILLECILVLCTNLQVSRDLLDNEILFMNYCVCL